MKYGSTQGSLMSEYGLVMALVAIAGIGGYAALGAGVTDLFKSFKAPGSPPTYTASNGGLFGQPSSNGQTSDTASNNPTAGNAGFVRLPDGTMLNLGNYPANLSKAVETTGVNGSTEQLLASLESLAASLAAEGKLTPEQTSAFSKLANMGHDLANVEKIIENSLAACGTDTNCVQNSPIVFQGQTYANVYDFSAANLGFDEGYATNCSASPTGCVGLQTPTAETIQQGGIPATGWAGASGNFAKEYEAIKSSGMLATPELNSIVTALSSQILLMSDSLETKTGGIKWGTASITNWQTALAADATQINSAGICVAGNGIDTSNVCQ